MDSAFERFRQWAWPAYAVQMADRDINPGTMTAGQKKELEKQETSLRADIVQIAKPEEFAKLTRALAESEAKRRESIEAKAGGIVQGAGIMTALFSVVPAVSGRAWTATGWDKIVLLVLFAAALVHLVMAIAMALAARRSGAIYLPSADETAEWAQTHRGDFVVEMAHQEIVRAKRNEGLIGMKANRLSAAETYYLRGLMAFALTFLFGLWIS